MSNAQPKQNEEGATPKWYVATLCREERSLAYLRIQATSQDEAETIADDYSRDEVECWEIVHGDDWVESVGLDYETQSHRFARIIAQHSAATVKERGQDDE
jgi:hypothetical protein